MFDTDDASRFKIYESFVFIFPLLSSRILFHIIRIVFSSRIFISSQFLSSFSLFSNSNRVARIVGPLLYFRWSVEGLRSDRLMSFDARSKSGLAVLVNRWSGIYPLLLPASSRRKMFGC